MDLLAAIGSALVVIVVAVITGLVAKSKGQSGLLWFVLGLLFPVLSLVIVVLLRGRDEPDVVLPPTLTEAAQSSPVARALHESSPRSVPELSKTTTTGESDVLRQLSALENLGLASRAPDGRWLLTDTGNRHMSASADS